MDNRGAFDYSRCFQIWRVFPSMHINEMSFEQFSKTLTMILTLVVETTTLNTSKRNFDNYHVSDVSTSILKAALSSQFLRNGYEPVVLIGHSAASGNRRGRGSLYFPGASLLLSQRKDGRSEIQLRIHTSLDRPKLGELGTPGGSPPPSAQDSTAVCAGCHVQLRSDRKKICRCELSRGS